MTKGRMTCRSDTPAAFIANNSSRSPKFPKVIKDANSNANGSDIGTIDTAA